MGSRSALGLLLAFVFFFGAFASTELELDLDLDHEHEVEDDAVQSSKSFDFFYFRLMWPGTYCEQNKAVNKSGCCFPKGGNTAEDFIIRGLFPYTNDGKAVTKCGKFNFSVNALDEKLVYEMQTHWSNIKCPSSNGVSSWKSLYKTYGLCSGFNQSEYFQKGLELHSKLNLLGSLYYKGLRPRDNGTYKFCYAQGAIDDVAGVETAIQCSNKDGQWLLYEIWTCVDKTATKFIQCPTLPTFTCAGKIAFPTFDYSQMNFTDSSSFNPIKMSV